MKNQDMHPFIVTSFNSQSVNDNDMANKCFEISTYMKYNGIDPFL